MTDQANWQHAIAILFWQALMLTALITTAMWFKSDATAADAPVVPAPAMLLSAECDEPSPHISTQAIKPATSKPRRARAGLLDVSLGI